MKFFKTEELEEIIFSNPLDPRENKLVLAQPNIPLLIDILGKELYGYAPTYSIPRNNNGFYIIQFKDTETAKSVLPLFQSIDERLFEHWEQNKKLRMATFVPQHFENTIVIRC